MSVLIVTMLGDFNVSADGKPITFQYKKVEALFIYLSVKKHATRDELSNLLWMDKNEITAKKNLRNAIYKLKECFDGIDNLLNISKTMIELSSETIISLDVDNFLNDESEIDMYHGGFLQNYSVKDADNFESWMLEKRDYLRSIYLKRLNERIEIEKNKNNLDEIEKYCKLIIKNDEFDENAYRNLLNCYQLQGKFSSGLELYDKLSEILEKELSITPELETEKVFSEFLKEMHLRHRDENKKVFFFGRKKELIIIDDNCRKFLDGDDAKSILIKGEMGIGKTWLKNKLISNFNGNNIYVFENECYQFEKEHRIKAWKNITLDLLRTIKQDCIKIPSNIYKFVKFDNSERDADGDDNLEDIRLGDLIDLMHSDNFEYLLLTLLNLISEKKKIAIVFEDIHWMDVDSISMLISILSQIDQRKIMFVITCRNEVIPSLENFYIFVKNYKKIESIELLRYTKNEVEGFINKARPNFLASKEILDKIYAETEGNTFFLTEYMRVLNSKKEINIMTTQMHDIIESKFLDMSKEEKRISEITSLFDNGTPLFIFKELLQKDELEILDPIENLENRYILEEINNNDFLSVKFTHRKLREFQYMNLSHVRKKVLHNKVAQLLEGRLGDDSRNIDLYYQIAYHFENANNLVGFLKYKIKILNVNLDFSHERFPVLRFESKIYNQFDFDDKRTKKKIIELEEILKKIKGGNEETLDVLNLEMSVLHIKGRYMIRRGVYEEGLKCIRSMMEIAQDVMSRDFIIEGCKQIILYCIQTNCTDMMLKYINYGYELAEEQKSSVNIGIFKRYDAIYNIMTGDNITAENLINECLDLFSHTGRSSNQYVLHTAACYDDMGEIKKIRGELPEALSYYEKAINLCEQKNIWISISLFYTHAGEIAYWTDKYDLAKKYFEKALDVYNRIKYNAEQPVAEAYMSLILTKEANYKSALKYLLKADKNTSILKIPKELGTVLRVKCELRYNMENNPELNEIFKDCLCRPFEEYAQEGIKMLKIAKEDHQIYDLEKFIQ